MEVLRALYVCASGLRFSGWSRQEYTPHTTASLLEPDRGPGGNRARNRAIPQAGAQTTRQLPKPTSREIKSHGAAARALHGATARARRHARSPRRDERKNAKNLELLRLDHTDPHRGSRGHRQNAKNLEFLPIPTEGRAGRSEIVKKTSSFCTSTTPIPAEGSSAQRKNADKNLEFLYLDHADSRRGSRGPIRNRKNLEFLHLDHADPRRGSQTRSMIKVLPRRPRKLNLTYIAANVEALCAWLALCARLYALGSVHSALCSWLYALGSMHLALCAWLYALGSTHLALCTWLYALGSTHLAPCTWLYARLYALDSAHSALRTWLYLHLALCAWPYIMSKWDEKMHA